MTLDLFDSRVLVSGASGGKDSLAVIAGA